MKTITESITKRRSIRTYNGNDIDNETLERLMNFSKGAWFECHYFYKRTEY